MRIESGAEDFAHAHIFFTPYPVNKRTERRGKDKMHPIFSYYPPRNMATIRTVSRNISSTATKASFSAVLPVFSALCRLASTLRYTQHKHSTKTMLLFPLSQSSSMESALVCAVCPCMPYSGVVLLLIFAETLQNLKCGAKVILFFDIRLKKTKKLTFFYFSSMYS